MNKRVLPARAKRVLGVAGVCLMTGVATFNSVSMTIEFPDPRNVYVVVYSDGAPFRLGHGDSIQIPVQVTPSDQPLTFRLAGTSDPRVQITVSAETGAQRTITVTDTTDPLDEPSGGNELLIRAYLPDGSEAQTEFATPIDAQLNLIESLYDQLRRKVNQTINDVPQACSNTIGDATQGQVQAEALNAGQPLTPTELTGWSNAAKFVTQGFCNEAGQIVGSDLQLAINGGFPPDPVPVSDLINRKHLRPTAPTPPPSVERTININLAPINVLVNPETNQPYAWRDFVTTPLNVSVSPWASQPSFKLNLSVNNAIFDTKLTGQFSLNNGFGGNSILFNQISIQYRVQFDYPSGGP